MGIRKCDRRGDGLKLPSEREDKNWASIPPPGHSTCGGNTVAGFHVDQEAWDAIFDEDGDEQGELVPA